MTQKEVKLQALNVDDFEIKARSQLSQPIYDFFAGGANDEISLSHNVTAFKNIRLQPRVLTGKMQCDISTSILNHELKLPILLAPAAFQQLLHEEGEIATTQAAEELGIINILSTLSTFTLEHIKSTVNNPVWFQLYIFKDRGLSESLIQRAESAGYQAIVVTVDVPIMGRRWRDARNNLQLSIQDLAKNIFSYPPENNSLENVKLFTDTLFDNRLTWQDITWLQSITKLPIIIKGITHPGDAKIALELGVAAIIVSNHGGRQLDGMPATIEVLPHIAKQINNKIPLLLDSGVRRGSDIFKALALGADAVLVGRPYLWGLNVNGQQGVVDVVTLLKNELCDTMTLCGFSTIEDIKSHGKSSIWSIAPCS